MTAGAGRMGHRRWQHRIGAVWVAGALVMLMALDPGASQAATVAEAPGTLDTLESREDNLAAVVDGLEIGEAAEATPLTAEAWEPPADDVESEIPADLPEADEQTVVLQGGVDDVTVGGMPVSLAPVDGEASPEAVTLRVADPAEAETAGVTGVLLDVSDASPDGVSDESQVEVTVSYADFAGVSGGDWASRLQIVELPACAAETPEAPECQPVPLTSSVNDPAGQTVTATIDLASEEEPAPAPDDEEEPGPDQDGPTSEDEEPEAEDQSPAPGDDTPDAGTETPAPEEETPAPEGEEAPASGEEPGTAEIATASMQTTRVAAASTSLAITAGAAGPAGDWGATSLAPSAAWGQSGGTGAFTWSYPLQVPSVPGGPSPELAISYSSAAVDGRVASTNNQASWVGEGFELATGYVERRYLPCMEDRDPVAGKAANNAKLSTGDLCWGSTTRRSPSTGPPSS